MHIAQKYHRFKEFFPASPLFLTKEIKNIRQILTNEATIHKTTCQFWIVVLSKKKRKKITEEEGTVSCAII